MTNTRSTKRALICSVIAIFVCCTMLVGTTYAWFTDSVTSAGNVIKTGKLDIAFEHKAIDETTWSDVEDTATNTIFHYENWEPGYVQARNIRVSNIGSLDLRYIINVIPANAAVAGEPDLADVIEVYIFDGETTVDRDALTTANTSYKGVLSSLLDKDGGAIQGVVYADDADKPGDTSKVYTIVLKMSDEAGNEYQDKTVNGSFTVELLATQLNSESDDIDSTYDMDADYDDGGSSSGGSTTPPLVYVGSAADLRAALTPTISADAATVVLTNDITLADGETWTPLDLEAYTGTVRNIVIDGQGHTISGLDAPLLGNCYFGNTSVEIKNLTLSDCEIVDKHYNGLGSAAFIAYADNSKSVTLENCHLVDSTITSTGGFIGIGGLIGYSSSPLTITDCSVTNCTITGAQNSAGAIAGHVSAGYDTTITNAKVIDCTVKGERVDKTGYVVGTSNNGNTVITTDAACANNTVFDVADSTTVYGRIVGGSLTLNGVAQ